MMKASIMASLLVLLPNRRSLAFITPRPMPRTSRTILARLHVLFPNKRGIIVQADGDFVAKDPLLDDFMGRRSSARDILRSNNAPSSPPSIGVRQSSVRGENVNRQHSNTDAFDKNYATDPNNMKIRDIQKELQKRYVYYGDCFDRESLVKRLFEARGMNYEIAPPDNSRGENDRTPDHGHLYQDSVFSYNETMGIGNGWREDNDANSFFSDQESAYGYKEMNDEPAYYETHGETLFDPSSPYQTSERWVYTNPVPPSTPPPGYYNR